MIIIAFQIILLLLIPILVAYVLHRFILDSNSILYTIRSIKGYLLLYTVISILSWSMFDVQNCEIKEDLLLKFGNQHFQGIDSVVPIIVNNYIHFTSVHLFMNLFFLSALSFIEFEIGSILFILIFIFCSLISSIIFSFVLPQTVILAGSSGGLMAIFSIIIANNLIINTKSIKLNFSSKVMEIVFGLIMVSIATLIFSGSTGHRIPSIYSFAIHIVNAILGYSLYLVLKFIFPVFFTKLVIYGKSNDA